MKIKTFLISIWVLILLPTMTYSLFVDTETSVGNTFSASTLVTNLYPEFPEVIEKELISNGEVTFIVKLNNTGELDTQNSISIPMINNKEFASLIKTEVRLNDNEIIYQGLLHELDIPKYLIQQPGQGDELKFIFFISEEDFKNTPEEFVNFKIQNHAWQTSMPSGNGFFHDQEIDVALVNPLKKTEFTKLLPISPLSPETQQDPRNELSVTKILEDNNSEI